MRLRVRKFKMEMKNCDYIKVNSSDSLLISSLIRLIKGNLSSFFVSFYKVTNCKFIISSNFNVIARNSKFIQTFLSFYNLLNSSEVLFAEKVSDRERSFWIERISRKTSRNVLESRCTERICTNNSTSYSSATKSW